MLSSPARAAHKARVHAPTCACATRAHVIQYESFLLPTRTLTLVPVKSVENSSVNHGLVLIINDDIMNHDTSKQTLAWYLDDLKYFGLEL